MKKLLNEPDDYVEETVEGLLLAHPRLLAAGNGDKRALVRADAPVEGKVAIATGGGSGHLPTFLGYVGPGLLDGCSVGNVFAAPSASQMLNVTKAIDGGAGVLYLYANYGGDVMNFEMAAEMAAAEGIEVRSVVVADDVASAPAEEAEQRRGVAGMGFAYKVAGAAAEAGRSLDEVEALARRAAEATRSVVIALSPCTVPASGAPTFEIGEGEMEFGMGIHGEAGLSREPIQPADQVADRMLDALYGELAVETGGSVGVLVNGLGATPPEELYIVYRRVHQALAERGVAVHRALVGEYATSLEMAGVSLSVIKLEDELAGYLDAPAETAFFATGNGIKSRI